MPNTGMSGNSIAYNQSIAEEREMGLELLADAMDTLDDVHLDRWFDDFLEDQEYFESMMDAMFGSDEDPDPELRDKFQSSFYAYNQRLIGQIVAVGVMKVAQVIKDADYTKCDHHSKFYSAEMKASCGSQSICELTTTCKGVGPAKLLRRTIKKIRRDEWEELAKDADDELSCSDEEEEMDPRHLEDYSDEEIEVDPSELEQSYEDEKEIRPSDFKELSQKELEDLDSEELWEEVISTFPPADHLDHSFRLG